MILEQYYIECLSHASYLIGDETTGRAVVVDPRRDITDYLADAAKYGLTIEGVINTHFHADFVSGHWSWSRPPGHGSGSARPPRPTTPFAGWPTASTSRSVRSTWRSCPPPDTPGSRSACWCANIPAPRPPRSHSAADCANDRAAEPARACCPPRRAESVILARGSPAPGELMPLSGDRIRTRPLGYEPTSRRLNSPLASQTRRSRTIARPSHRAASHSIAAVAPRFVPKSVPNTPRHKRGRVGVSEEPVSVCGGWPGAG